MMKTKNKVIAKELYDEVFDGYESSKEKNRIRKIFDQKSEFNKQLNMFGVRVKEHVPELEKEMKKLGFDRRLKVRLDDFIIPNYTDYYYNDKGDVIQIAKYGESMFVVFKDQEITFKSKYLGENEREFLKWLKLKIS